MEHIKTLFERIRDEPYPSEGGKEVCGVDLIMTDSATMGLSEWFVKTKGHLPADKVKILENCYNELKLILPHLEKKEKQYFASLKQLAGEILNVTKGEKLSDSEIELRHKWKSVYDQIKVVVNELDPLGVADVVDDEYDDLNFRIYSQLLDDRKDEKLFETIKTFLQKDYGVTIPDNAISEAIVQLKKIEA